MDELTRQLIMARHFVECPLDLAKAMESRDKLRSLLTCHHEMCDAIVAQLQELVNKARTVAFGRLLTNCLGPGKWQQGCPVKDLHDAVKHAARGTSDDALWFSDLDDEKLDALIAERIRIVFPGAQ